MDQSLNPFDYLTEKKKKTCLYKETLSSKSIEVAQIRRPKKRKNKIMLEYAGGFTEIHLRVD
jgi:hypothetical protein